MLCLSWREQVSDFLFRASHEFVEDLRSVYNLRLFAVESFCDLPSNESFACARRTVKQHAFAVLDAVLLNYLLRIAARVESASKDLGELLIKTSDAKLLKAHILFEKLLGLTRVHFDGRSGLLADFESEYGILINNTVVESACMIQCVE